MKKIAKLIFILCLTFILFGCKKTETPELIELNIYELIDLFDSNETLIFAILNENDSNYSNLKKQIELYQSISNNYVYYIDTTNIQGFELEFINVLVSEDPEESRIYILNNGELILDEDGTITYQELRRKIGEKNYEAIDINKIETARNNYYLNGTDKLSVGKIGTSFMEVYMAQPLKEAKELLESENLYNLLNHWEVLQQNGNNCEYLSLQFVKGEDVFYQKHFKGKCSNLDYDKLTRVKYEYYLKENVLMIKQEKETEYKDKYLILELTTDSLNVSSDKKIYNLQPYEN